MRENSWKGAGNSGDKWRELNLRQVRAIGKNVPNYDSETAMFISMSQELKQEGNRWFLRKDYEGALIKYDKATKLLPKNHEDMACVRCNMAECYMQIGLGDYPMAINECNLALEVDPTYSKALLKRARCYEGLDRVDLAIRDVETVLKMEPNNHVANDIENRLKKTLQRQGSRFDGSSMDSSPSQMDVTKETSMEMEGKNAEEKTSTFSEVEAPSRVDEKSGGSEKHKSNVMRITEDQNTEDKVVVKEKIASTAADDGPKQTMKLVFEEDIRLAQVPVNCDISKLREIISDRFPKAKRFVVKYKDQEGDFVTIATTEELRWAEAGTKQGYLRLYVHEVKQDSESRSWKTVKAKIGTRHIFENKNSEKSKEVAREETTCITDWIIQFAQFFKNYIGFDMDAYIDLHEAGMRLHSEAMEDTVTSEEAQELLSLASDKFLEMAALALFNCGNVHMARARKKVNVKEESSRESMAVQVKRGYEWAQKELTTAGEMYQEALELKPNLYEAVLAIGQHQFEQAKLSWYYAIGTGVNLEKWPSGDVLMLYNDAEENMERGLQMWEEQQKERLRDRYKKNRMESLLKRMKLDSSFKEMSADEMEEQSTNFRSQIHVLWGTILYERSIMEYKLGISVWHECLEAAIEKFELAGASTTDISVMIKNHCGNGPELKGMGMGFNIDEIVRAWNEMYEAKKWQHNASSFRLEPLLRRRVLKLYHVLERA